MEQITINLYHIFKFVIVLFAVIGGYSVIKDIINAFSRCFKDKLDHKKDCELMKNLCKRETRLITIENAQEIHELNKKYDKIEEEVEKILEKLNGK